MTAIPRAIVFVGPPGSGKTTLAGQVFRSGQLPGKRTFYIVNDDGGGSEETVDAGILSGIDGLDLNAMTSGCIGCKDSEEFRDLIEQMVKLGAVNQIVVEPVGFAKGDEVPEILRQCGLEPVVVCLVDVQNFGENMNYNFMPTQVGAASMIGLTKYPPGIQSVNDPSLEPILEFIGEHNSHAPIFLLPLGSGLPEWALQGDQHSEPEHDHDHSACDHNHDGEEEDHDHGVYTVSLRLEEGVRVEDLQALIGSNPSGIFRGKGVTQGRQFHLVHGKWEQTIVDGRKPFATFYSTSPLDVDDFAGLAIPTEEAYAGKDIRQILRMNTVPVAEIEEVIRRRLGKLPKEVVVNRFGLLVTHPESILMIHELARREGVDRALFNEVIRACVRYWLSAAEALTSERWRSNPSFSEWQRAIGTALGYFGYHQFDEADLGSELMQRIIEAKPAHMLFDGLKDLRRLHSNDQRAKVWMNEIREIAEFGIVNEGMTKLEAISTMRHCLRLANGRPELVDEWEKTIKAIESFGN